MRYCIGNGWTLDYGDSDLFGRKGMEFPDEVKHRERHEETNIGHRDKRVNITKIKN
jgi:hypothetical protein